MTRRQIQTELRNSDYEGIWAALDKEMQAAFLRAMRGRHYGYEALTDALGWFINGYRAALSWALDNS